MQGKETSENDQEKKEVPVAEAAAPTQAES